MEKLLSLKNNNQKPADQWRAKHVEQPIWLGYIDREIYSWRTSSSIWTQYFWIVPLTISFANWLFFFSHSHMKADFKTR